MTQPTLPPPLADHLLLAAQSLYLETVARGVASAPLVLTLATPWPPETPRLAALLQAARGRLPSPELPADSPFLHAAFVVILARHLLETSSAPRASETGRAFCRLCQTLRLRSAAVWVAVAFLAHHLARQERFDLLPTLARLRAAVHARWHDCEASDG